MTPMLRHRSSSLLDRKPGRSSSSVRAAATPEILRELVPEWSIFRPVRTIAGIELLGAGILKGFPEKRTWGLR